MLSHHVPWLIPITIAIVAFLARLLFRLYGIEKPGALLVIMSTAMGTSNNFPLHKIPIMASFVLLGVVTGIIMGIVLHFIDKRPTFFKTDVSSRTTLYRSASLLDALHYAAILFLAAYLSQSLHLVNAYWMTFTCAAILQGENLHSVMQRNVQRILGTSLGLLLSAILLMIPLHLYKQSVSLVFYMQLLKDSLTETMRLPAFYYPDVLIIIKSCTTASH